MRKITSKHDLQKTNRRKQAMVGIVLVGLMLVSIIGYAFQVNPNTNANTEGNTGTYKGYPLSTFSGYWNLKVGNFTFVFAENPADSYALTSALNPAENYYGKPVYLYSESVVAEAEIFRNMHLLSSGVTYACPEGETNCRESWPVKTCSDNFIVIRESNKTGITQKGGCVYIEGPAEKMTGMADGFILKILGI